MCAIYKIWASAANSRRDMEVARHAAVMAEINEACQQCALLTPLDDKAFVAEVRRLELERPAWTNLNVWPEFVRREIDMRLLLK
jgi:hypothetical protein